MCYFPNKKGISYLSSIEMNSASNGRGKEEENHNLYSEMSAHGGGSRIDALAQIYIAGQSVERLSMVK